MAMKLAVATADAALTAIAGLLNNGYLRIYKTTTSEPATAEAGTLDLGTTHTLLAELRFAATAFNTTTATVDVTPGLTSSGNDRVMTAFPIANDAGADADGTAAFFRCYSSNGTSPVYQGTVGTSGQQLNLGATNIVAGGVVSVSSLTITLPTA